MAIQTKAIKQKMKSVQNIGKITKAMEMISVSKMKKSVTKRLASAVFAQHSFDLLKNLSKHTELSHPYLQPRSGGNTTLMVIIASNKGLCGGYNMNVSKQVSRFIKKYPDTHIETIVVGKQAEKIALRNGLSVVASFTEFSDYFTASEVRSLITFITERYDTHPHYTSVAVAYTEFISSLSFEAKIQNLIPLSIDDAQTILGVDDSASAQAFAQYRFEPSEQEVLESVVPNILLTLLYQFLLESLASEHSSRVSAMKSASDNAKEMLEELTINYNRARQAGITQEIAEIVGGSSAMAS